MKRRVFTFIQIISVFTIVGCASTNSNYKKVSRDSATDRIQKMREIDLQGKHYNESVKFLFPILWYRW